MAKGKPGLVYMTQVDIDWVNAQFQEKFNTSSAQQIFKSILSGKTCPLYNGNDIKRNAILGSYHCDKGHGIFGSISCRSKSWLKGSTIRVSRSLSAQVSLWDPTMAAYIYHFSDLQFIQRVTRLLPRQGAQGFGYFSSYQCWTEGRMSREVNEKPMTHFCFPVLSGVTGISLLPIYRFISVGC